MTHNRQGKCLIGEKEHADEQIVMPKFRLLVISYTGWSRTLWNNNSQLLELHNRDFLEMGKGMLWGSVFVEVQRTEDGWCSKSLNLLPRVLSLLFPVLNILGILEHLHQSWDSYYHYKAGSQVLEKESGTKGSSLQVPSLLGINHPHEFTWGLWAAFARPHRLAERLCDHGLGWILYRRGRSL